MGDTSVPPLNPGAAPLNPSETSGVFLRDESNAAPSAPLDPRTASLLGIDSEELDQLKDRAKNVAPTRASKREKLSHDHFFENANGLDKVMRTFHKIKFRGKGHEFEDLRVLLQSYDKWQRELYSVGEPLEDFALAARNLLSENTKNDEGMISNPHSRLHESRFEYKKWEAVEARKKNPPVLTEEMRQRIEANRLKALEMKRKRASAEMDADAAAVAEMEAAAAAISAPSSQKAPSKAPVAARPASFDDEEDPFGFGFGMDDDDGFSSAAPAPQAAVARPAAAQTAAAFDEEEDPFGFGFDMDEGPEEAAPPPKPATVPTPVRATCFDEEDDPFGRGFDMDDA